MKKWKSRKLFAFALLYVTATTFVILGRAEFMEWAQFIQWVFGIYAAGNVGEHVSSKFKTNQDQ